MDWKVGALVVGSPCASNQRSQAFEMNAHAMAVVFTPSKAPEQVKSQSVMSSCNTSAPITCSLLVKPLSAHINESSGVSTTTAWKGTFASTNSTHKCLTPRPPKEKTGTESAPCEDATSEPDAKCELNPDAESASPPELASAIASEADSASSLDGPASSQALAPAITLDPVSEADAASSQELESSEAGPASLQDLDSHDLRE